MYVIKAFIGSSEEIVYSPDTQDERPVLSAKVSFELNEGGGLDFILVHTHPLYNLLHPISTYIAAYDDGEEIFYGRIIGKSDPTFTGQISYQSEGAICLLKDSQIPPEARDSNGKLTSRTLTAEAFFRWCIQQHNQQLNDPRRTFTVGEVTATKRNETREYQIGSYTETKSALDQYITGVYGGYIRIRNSGGTRYIDWIQDYGRTDPQEILIGENVRSMNSTFAADGFYTVLLPVGNNGLTLDTPTIDLFGPTEMALYGRIIKPVTFSNVDNKQDLQKMANDYVSRVSMIIPCEQSIQLIDLHYLDGTIPKIRLGDKFTSSGTTLTVGHIDSDLINPENDAFAFRNKHDIEGDVTGSSRGTLSGKTTKNTNGLGMSLKYYTELDDEAILNAKTIQILGSTVHTQGENIDSLSAIVDDQGEEIRTIQGTEVIQNSTEIANVAGKFQLLNNYYDDWPEWRAGVEYKVGDKVKVLGSQGGYYGYICTTAHTSSVWSSDRPQYWTEHHGRQGVRLLDGSAFEIDDDNGIRMTVGTRINDIDGTVADINQQISVFAGSALWTQRDNITAIAGEYEIQVDPVTGKKSLVIKNGGGFRLRYNNSEYGIFHEGNLEGGMLVKAINTGSYTGVRTVWFSNDYRTAYSDASRTHQITGQAGVMYIDAGNTTGDNYRYKWNSDTQKYELMMTYETHITGDRVIVGTIDDETAETMQDKFGDLDGLIAEKATIGQLNALSAVIEDLEVDNVSVANLKAAFQNVDLLTAQSLQFYDGSTPQGGPIGRLTNLRSLVHAVKVVEDTDNPGQYKLLYQTGYSGWGTDESTWIDGGTFNRAAPAVVTLSGSWSGGVLTVTPSPSGQPWIRSFVQDTPEWTGYDVSIPVHVHRTAGSSDYDEGTIMSAFVSVPSNLRYSTGQNDVTITKGPWSNGIISFTKSAGTASTKSVQLCYKTTWSGNDASIDIWDGTAADASHGVYTGYTVPVDASGRYTAGQNNVTITKGSWASGKISFTKSAGTASTKSVQLTAAAPSWNGNTASVVIWDGTAADTSHGVSTGYTVSVDASGRYNAGGATAKVNKSSTTLGYGKSITVTAQYVNASGTTVNTSSSCKITAPADNSGTGWSLAVGKVALPKSNTSATMSVTTPGSTYNTSGATSYVVSADNTYAYVKISGTTTVVARATHNAFSNGQTDGRNGVTITKGSWSGGKISFTKSAGTASTKSVQLCQKTTWSGNTASVAIWDGTAADTSHGVSTGYTVSVDASGRYSAGWTDYYNSSYWAKATRANSFNAKIPNSARNGSENWDCGVRAALSLYLNNSPSGWKKPADGVSWNVCYPNPSSIGSSDNDAFPTPVTWFSAQPSVSNVQWYPSDSSSWPASGPYDANTAFSSLASMILAHTTKKDRGYIYFDVNVNNKFRRYYIAIG